MKFNALFALILVVVGCGRREGPQGEPGKEGATGTTGATGQAGNSCSVTKVSNGALISCTDGTQTVVLDGKDGTTVNKGQPKCQ